MEKSTQETFLDAVLQHHENMESLPHPYDIAEQLLELRDTDPKAYRRMLAALPETLKAQVLIELPLYCQEEVLDDLSAGEIAELTNTLDTDDAAELDYAKPRFSNPDFIAWGRRD